MALELFEVSAHPARGYAYVVVGPQEVRAVGPLDGPVAGMRDARARLEGALERQPLLEVVQ